MKAPSLGYLPRPVREVLAAAPTLSAVYYDGSTMGEHSNDEHVAHLIGLGSGFSVYLLARVAAYRNPTRRTEVYFGRRYAADLAAIAIAAGLNAMLSAASEGKPLQGIVAGVAGAICSYRSANAIYNAPLPDLKPETAPSDPETSEKDNT